MIAVTGLGSALEKCKKTRDQCNLQVWKTHIIIPKKVDNFF